MSKANPLVSYVEKYILNPSSKIRLNLDDDNEETRAVVSKQIEGEESAKAVQSSISKLRLQNAEALGDRDSRYRGKTVSRKVMEGTHSSMYDPELAKLCSYEGASDLEKEDSSDESVSDDDEYQNCDDHFKIRNPLPLSTQTDKCSRKKKKGYEEQQNDDFMQLGEEVTEDFDINSDYEDDDEEESDDNEEEGDDDEEEGDDEGEEQSSPITMKTFNTESTDHIDKGIAVKNQCSISDALFEARIGLQKVSSIGNQLPQYDIYEEFLKNKNYPQYKVNLVTARKAMKRLIAELIDFQDVLLLNNPETRNILTGNRAIDEHNSDDAASGGDESSQKEKKGIKRKTTEFEQVLNKRHKALVPFRDESLNMWYEKAKLLVNQTRGNFSSFEVPPAHQIRNILANRDELLKRTQLVGVSRGNVCKILGKKEKEENSVVTEEYDPEIFDDSDFYSRMLEDLLKSKMSVSDDMTEVSRKWIDIQKLRKKAKKNVDTRASKGRKIRFEMMSKLQQFIAPCKPSQMDDAATNKLFSSLFDQSAKNYSESIK